MQSVGDGRMEGPSLDVSLIDLMEELVRAIELRDASATGAPAPETLARIERLEMELAGRLAQTRRSRRHPVGRLELLAPLAAGH